MSTIATRLKHFFSAPATRTWAEGAPLLVAAGAASAIIGAAAATPAFASAGVGMVLTSVAANLASSIAYDLVKPELPDDERERRIARGLRQRDPAVIRVVAEALVAGGADVAQALPADTRAELIAALQEGMAEPGGALAAIAPRYAQALASPATSWPALTAELHATVRAVSQTIEATAGGVASGNRQHTQGADGPIEQVIRASGQGSRAENNIQSASRSGAAAAPHSPPPAPHGERAHRQSLLAGHTRRLQELEQRAAREGLHTPPEITIEIEQLKHTIAQLAQQLRE